MLVRHIVFPVDFSPPCDAIAPAVAAMAKRAVARVSLLYVARPPDGLSDFAPLHGHFLTAAEEMRGILAGYQAPLFDGIDTDPVFAVGQPVREIVGLAHQSKAGLIMMPTRGHSPFRQLLLGSVTAGVLHDADCPVWTCAHAEDSGAPPPKEYRSIVCAVDGGPDSQFVLAAAGDLARLFGASLHPIHVRHPAAAGGPSAPPVETFDSTGIVAGVVTAEERYRADLLVIGRGKAQGLLGRLRSNAHDLIRMSRCPVLSI